MTAAPSRTQPDTERALLAKMVYEAVRFAVWAAGEGFFPVDGEDAAAPEDFLFEYCTAMNIDAWEGLPDVARDAVALSRPHHSPQDTTNE